MPRPTRMVPLLAIALAAQALPARADDAWFVTRTVMPGEVLRQADVEVRPLDTPLVGLFGIDRSPAELEAKRRLMAGRPLMARDVGRHAVVRASTDVRVVWRSGGIRMEMTGRALQDGAPGDDVRVLNTMSARTLRGTVMADGSVQVEGGS
jgi:flagellar basal body P-ring formation protein FlgA